MVVLRCVFVAKLAFDVHKRDDSLCVLTFSTLPHRGQVSDFVFVRFSLSRQDQQKCEAKRRKNRFCALELVNVTDSSTECEDMRHPPSQ